MARRSYFLLTRVLGLALLSACSATGEPLRSVVDPSERLYTNPVYRWSISYPGFWTVDGGDPSFVRIYSSANEGLCGIHSNRTVPFKTVDDFTNSAIAENEQQFMARGLRYEKRVGVRLLLFAFLIGNPNRKDNVK